MADDTNNSWQDKAKQAMDEIQAALAIFDQDTGIPPAPTEEALRRLTLASEHLGASISEAMAQAALEGSSMRKLAGITGVAPNSVPPRLARSAALSPYATPEGTVSAESIAVARYQTRTEQEVRPLTFQPRRKG